MNIPASDRAFSTSSFDAYIDHLASLYLEDPGNASLQRQGISAPYTLLLERFDVVNAGGEIEILSDNIRAVTRLTPKQYRFIQERPPHSHEYIEVMLVLSGSVVNHVEEESFLYRAGQGCIMNEHIRHKEEATEDAEILFIELRPEFIREMLNTMDSEKTVFQGATLAGFLQSVASDAASSLYSRQYWDFSPSADESVIRPARDLLCHIAVSALREKTPGSSYLIRAAILGFLADLGNSNRYTLQQISSELSHGEYLAAKIELLIRASHGKIRRQDMEKQLSYNSDYLNRLFRQVKGQSIAGACQDVMLTDAAHLLRHTDLSIDAIMEQLQITSRGHFFSLFQSRYGLTPNAYRQDKDVHPS